MFLTKKEILDTPNALGRTLDCVQQLRPTLEALFRQYPTKKFCFFGCGSSYMLAKGAAELFRTFPDTGAAAIAAGDYLVDPQAWENTVKGSILVSISRSGRTSEMVWALQHAKKAYGCPVLSLSMEAENDITPFANLEIIMDWCYDRSVCQTRTVTNLYAALLLAGAIYAEDETLWKATALAVRQNADFQQGALPVLEQLAGRDWNSVVVLADGPLCGIAEEGALAFTEISMMIGRYFHVLDYRHGPIVVSGRNTLTLMVLRPEAGELQKAMAKDVIAKGGIVLTVSGEDGNPCGADAHIRIAGLDAYPAWGIPFIYLAQMLAYLKAVALGGNPDAPEGLDAYIKLG